LGDAVAERLVAGLSGRPVLPVEKRDRRKLLACGSVIHRARPGDVVWGTGSQHPEQRPASAAIDVRAVRGPLTRRNLLDAGVACPEVYGDPALLLPAVLPRARARPHYRLGVVPHYQDKPRVRIDDPAVRVLDIQGSLEPFLDELLACERVVSSSLHGVVFAEAYGIPAHELRIGDDVRGADHKFTDYYSGTRRERPVPLALDEIAREPEWRAPEIDPALAGSFPFPPEASAYVG
jgi:pyruvyltransferase